MRKIVLTGPESTGKSTLAKKLSAYFGVQHTREQARIYLNALERPYVFEDLEKIAERQIAAEDILGADPDQLLFCDTDLITIKIWSDYKYGKVSPRISKWIEERKYDLYLLCRPDIPWIPDPLRENPHNRDFLFDLHLDELNRYGKTFEIIEGDWELRTEKALAHVQKYLKYWMDVPQW